MTNTDPRIWTAAQWLEWAREEGARTSFIKWLKSLPSCSLPWEQMEVGWRRWQAEVLPLRLLHYLIDDPDWLVREAVARRLPPELLTQMMGDSDWRVRNAVTHRLQKEEPSG